MADDENPLVSMAVADLIARWRPGSHDTADTPDGANLDWTWAHEAHYLLTEQRDYQVGVITRAHKDQGVGWVDQVAPILLGNDGRVWDGHHRICAAMALGIPTVMVDIVPASGDGPSPTTCGRCGRRPATGLASIDDVRYCHDGDGSEPTCYELAQRGPDDGRERLTDALARAVDRARARRREDDR